MSINVLAIAGDDAFQNEWQVIVPTFPGLIDGVQMNIRATSVSTPALSFESYDVHYKTESAKKPGGKQSTDKTLTISFRVDKYYKVYKSLHNWFNLIHNHTTGNASPDFVAGVSVIRVPITIIKLDANGIPTDFPEVYNGCYITGVPSREYTYEQGNPLVLSFTFTYMNQIVSPITK